MSKKKIAVAVIHGMGAQKSKEGMGSDELTFSKGLNKKIKNALGAGVMAQVAWREIYWQGVLQERQTEYFDKLDFGTTWTKARKFVLSNLSDAGSYRKTHDDKDDIYEKIHACVKDTISELLVDVGEGAPLIIVAHSLGAQVISNYIYDMWDYDVTKASKSKPKAIKLRNTKTVTKGKDVTKIKKNMTPTFETMGTLKQFITFGCNIPVFIFAYDPADIKPVRPPVSWTFDPENDPPWWVNFYDQTDDLGYPLRPIGGAYEELVNIKHIKEIPIDSGFTFPFLRHAWSHNSYWNDWDVFYPIATSISQALNGSDPANSAKPTFCTRLRDLFNIFCS